MNTVKIVYHGPGKCEFYLNDTRIVGLVEYKCESWSRESGLATRVTFTVNCQTVEVEAGEITGRDPAKIKGALE
jgi:hypothetical protein